MDSEILAESERVLKREANPNLARMKALWTVIEHLPTGRATGTFIQICRSLLATFLLY